ncbi:MAG: hypothetical protein K1X88_30015 [Nannocystaceae bacterium]|nr:hypothetical protein [Nannocystaceae bacterium]
MNPSVAVWCLVVAATPARSAAAPAKPAASKPAASKPATGPAAARPRVEVLRLRAQGLELATLRAELALRLHQVQIVEHDSAPAVAADTMFVFVDLRPLPEQPSSFTLTIVASDGRAYDRTIDAGHDAPRDDVTRLVAGNVANLVSAIESGTVRADREDVPVPEAAPQPQACPACPDPPAPPQCPEPAVHHVDAPLPEPAIELGIGITPLAVLGLGPPRDADHHAGSGGALSLALRLRNGLLVTAEGRFAGRGMADTATLLRGRAALGIGYAWRRNAFELAGTAAFTVEPWSVRASGSRRAFADEQGTARPRRPLLGGAARIVAAHVWRTKGGTRLRLGPMVELAASSAPGDRGKVVELLDQGLRPIGRTGGLELGLGVDLTVWFGLGRQPDLASSSAGKGDSISPSTRRSKPSTNSARSPAS